VQTGVPSRLGSATSTSASDVAVAPPLLHRNPGAVAWVVLWSAFGVFLALCALGVAAGFYYRASATDVRPATVSVIGGTVLISARGQGGWTGVRDEAVLQPGDTLSTDDASRALLTLADGSTVTVFPATQLALSRAEALRFGARTNRVTLHLQRGKIRLGVAPVVFAGLEMRMTTPETEVDLAEGSYTFELAENRTQVWVREIGGATVRAGGQTRQLHENQRLEVARGGSLGEPLPARQELVANGDFEEGLTGWTSDNRSKEVPGTVDQVALDGRRAVHFLRQGSKGVHNDTYIVQDINRDVSDFSSLHLSFEVKLVNHSVPGGGYLGSEYPILVKVSYRAQNGDLNLLVYGYYYQNDSDPPYPTTNGKKIAQGQWVAVTLPENLMNLRPRTITSIEVSASGHDYESYIARISLVYHQILSQRWRFSSSVAPQMSRLRYFQPPSARMATTVAFSRRRATRRAACMTAPAETPAKMPSRRVSSRAQWAASVPWTTNLPLRTPSSKTGGM
jgi:hypothetical protein